MIVVLWLAGETINLATLMNDILRLNAFLIWSKMIYTRIRIHINFRSNFTDKNMGSTDLSILLTENLYSRCLLGPNQLRLTVKLTTTDKRKQIIGSIHHNFLAKF